MLPAPRILSPRIVISWLHSLPCSTAAVLWPSCPTASTLAVNMGRYLTVQFPAQPFASCSASTKALQGRGPQSQFGSSLPTKKPQGNSHRRRSTAHRSASFSRQFARSRRARKFSQTPNLRYARGQRSEEHTSELQSLMRISYAVFCLKQNKK